jgi:niacin transporter
MKKNQTIHLVLTALCIALGVVLPIALHSIPNAGKVLLPMHIPVLLCGLMCGWPYGLACGILTPLLSSLLTGMPPMAFLPSMLFELATYGLVSGILILLIHTGKRIVDIYIQLVVAMLAGRLIYGILNTFIFSAGSYSMAIFISGAFVTALPGIIIQLILLPAIILILEKAKVIDRYAYSEK